MKRWTRIAVLSGVAMTVACAAGSSIDDDSTDADAVDGVTSAATSGAGGTSGSSESGNMNATSTATGATTGGASTSSSAGNGGSSSSAMSSGGAGGTSNTSSTSSTATSGSTGAGGTPNTGPVSAGNYSYQDITALPIMNPAAAAFHPSGSYALVLSYRDKVHRIDTANDNITEVGSAGTKIYWRDVEFLPTGDAVLLAYKFDIDQARIYLWDHLNQTLTEKMSERWSGGGNTSDYRYEALALSPASNTIKLLGKRKVGSAYNMYLWDFDPIAGRSGLTASNSSAGCQDAAWATDNNQNPALAIVCGENNVALYHQDANATLIQHSMNAGNTSRLSSRPQEDYALAICWSCGGGGKVYRFETGTWTTSFNSPLMPGAYQVEFSTTGERALLVGEYNAVYEYRHDLMNASDFTDVSIPNFTGPSQTRLNDVAWRPGCDAGLLVGGASSTRKVIRFSVSNGIACTT